MSDPEGSPSVSIILCSRGRAWSLRRCLDSMRVLDDDDHEILVVDNHPSPTIAVADDRVRVVHEPRPGLDRARNRGIAEARGEIVVYVDDDCEVDPSLLKAIREPFRDHDVACVTGRVIAASTDTAAQWWFERLMSFDRGPEQRRFVMDQGTSVALATAGRLGTGCNMAFRKEVFDRVGPFDEALDMGTLIGGGGDLDMFARILAAGEHVAYEPTAIVYHHHRETLAKLARQLFGYGVAIGALTAKVASSRRRSRLRGALAYQRAWFRSTYRRIDRSSALHRVASIAFVLLAVLGDVCGPVVYVLSRRRARA